MPARIWSLAPARTLAVPQYRRLWFASLLWNHARWIDQVIIGWLVLEITNSAWNVALTGVLRSLPVLVFGILGGAIADRVNRRSLLIVSQASGLVVALAVASFIAAGSFTFETAMVASLLFGLQWAIDFPVRRALVPDLVGREMTVNAIALESVSMNFSKVIGPLVAGWLIAVVGAWTGYVAIAALFGAQIVLIAPLRLPPGVPAMSGESLARYVARGFGEMRRSQAMVGVLLITVYMNVLAFPYQTLLPVFARDVLGVDSIGLGVLGAASGIGSFLGAMVLASKGSLPRPGWLFASGSVAMSGSLIAFALTRDFGVAIGALAISGLGSSAFAALQSTIILRSASDHLRGRAMGILTMAIGTAPFGLLEIGALSVAIGPPVALALNAGLCAILVAATAAALPGFRSLRR